MAGVKILDAEKRHILPVMELDRKTFSHPCTESFLTSCIEDGHIFKVAEKNNITAAYVIVQTVLDEAYFYNIAVDENERGCGIGDSLMLSLNDEAKSRQLAFMTLEVRASNESAINMYLKHGYSKVGTRKNYYDMPKEDAIIMTKYFK